MVVGFALFSSYQRTTAGMQEVERSGMPEPRLVSSLESGDVGDDVHIWTPDRVWRDEDILALHFISSYQCILVSSFGTLHNNSCDSLGWTPDRVWRDEDIFALYFMSSYQCILVSSFGTLHNNSCDSLGWTPDRVWSDDGSGLCATGIY